MGIQVEGLVLNKMPWEKEYIDFSFSGKHISDFGLVATTSGDRYQFNGSPEFEDETSTVKGVWGQYYWGTNYKTKTYTYNLSTDGMTERQFQEFKYHFRPGHYGQFYEDAWFDKYCYVRVKQVIDFSFVPFQEDVTIAGANIKSRMYKGECKISFIQDRPFQYSFYQVLESSIEDLLKGENNDNRQAALRMMYHSNIPAIDSWTKREMKCATGSYLSLPARDGDNSDASHNSIIFNNTNFIPYYNPSTFPSEAILEFKIKRTITKPNFDTWEPVYFNEINNEFIDKIIYYNTINSTDKIISSLNSIDTDVGFIHNFKYTMPEISAEVNKAINIAWNFYEENGQGALGELSERLQEELINSKVLLWAIKILQKIQFNYTLYCPEITIIDEDLSEEEFSPFEDSFDSVLGQIVFHSGDHQEKSNGNEDVEGCLRLNKVMVYCPVIKKEGFEVDWIGYFNIMMLMMFCNFNGEDGTKQSQNTLNDILTPNTFINEFYAYTLKFDSEKAQAFVNYKVNSIEDNRIRKNENVEENCSNIVSSSYLKMQGGDTLDISTGKIASFHKLVFNRGEKENMMVDNVKLEYKYTYV